MAYLSTVYWYNRNLLPSLIVFYNNRSVQSEFMSQASKLVTLDISIVSILIPFVFPCVCSVF